MRRPQSIGARRAFSLVEVLLAVLVLGLGLLGLAAVFPVIISQQRDATDNVAGVAAAASVEAVTSSTSVLDGLGSILLDPAFGRDVTSDPVDEDGNPSNTDEDWARNGTFLWEPAWASVVARNDLRYEGLLTAGDGDVLVWDDTDVDPRQHHFNTFAEGQPGHPGALRLPVPARLVPPPYTGGQPQFVWDVAPMRTIENQLRLAIFVRRVDSGIRAPSGYTLSDVIGQQNDDVAQSEWRLPIGMDEDGRPTGGGAPYAGGSGDDSYGVLLTLRADVYEDPNIPDDEEVYDRVVLRAPNNRIADPWNLPATAYDVKTGVVMRAASRPGQLLVDNVGQVRTVLEVAEVGQNGMGLGDVRNGLVLRVRPAFTRSQVADLRLGSRNDKEFKASVVRQVIFSSKPPIRVIVRTVGG